MKTEQPDWDIGMEHGLRQELAQKKDLLLDLTSDRSTAEALGGVSQLPQILAWIKSVKRTEEKWIKELILMDREDAHRAGMLRGRIRALRSVTAFATPDAAESQEIDAHMTGLRDRIQQLEDVLRRR